MLQTTVERLLPRIPAQRQAVVTNAGQAELIHQELHRKGWDEVRIWIEPEGKIPPRRWGWRRFTWERRPRRPSWRCSRPIIFIRDQASLLQALDLGAHWAQAGYLGNLRHSPTRPETGYGYIKQGLPG